MDPVLVKLLMSRPLQLRWTSAHAQKQPKPEGLGRTIQRTNFSVQPHSKTTLKTKAITNSLTHSLSKRLKTTKQKQKKHQEMTGEIITVYFQHSFLVNHSSVLALFCFIRSNLISQVHYEQNDPRDHQYFF